MPLNSGAQGGRLDIRIWKILENTKSHSKFSPWSAELKYQTWGDVEKNWQIQTQSEQYMKLHRSEKKQDFKNKEVDNYWIVKVY